MFAITKKQLVKKLNDYYEDKDLLLAVWWAKDEFDGNFSKDITNKTWRTSIEDVDTESQEQEIKELIEIKIMESLRTATESAGYLG